MNKKTIIRMLVLSILMLLSSTVLAETAKIENTIIDYVPYRELVVDEPGVVYQIKITNTGTREKTYEIVPDTNVIKEIGTYRIDPSDKITIEPDQQETVSFYLGVEKETKGRIVIPVEVRSGLAETKINLVARSIGPLQSKEKSNALIRVFKIILIIIIVIIILIAISLSLRKRREEEDEEDFEADFDEDIETYY